MIRIFAYGSNLCTDRLRRRIRSARFLGRARLPGYSLRFHKRGRDGSGKANVVRTGRAGDCVWGAVFECSERDRQTLDRFEVGYRLKRLAVVRDDGTTSPVHVYVAGARDMDPSLRPFRWYHGYVLRGAEQHGLPPEYLTALNDCPTIPDPDRERAARNTPVPA